MTDTEKEYVAQDERKVTWGLVRKVNLGNYESMDVSVYLTDFAPKSTKNMAKFVTEKSESAFDTLKAQVWGALDLEFEFSEEGRPSLVEQTAPAPPAPTVVPNQNQTPQAAAPAPQQANAPQPRPAGPAPSMAQVGYYPETPAFCKDCGERDFYDNRTDIDDKIKAGKRIGPDFKCKACKKGGVWRPGSYDYNEALKGGTGAAMAPPPPAEPSAEPF